MASVLIVDDEPNIRRMVGALLRSEGFDVREASTGVEGVASIADDEPDVTLLDLMIPGELDGLATLGRIRERWSDLPVVMMSGRASLADAVRATKLGAVNFLEKPLAPETVLLALGSALELRQSRRTTRALREELGLTGEMVGSSSAMARVREVIARVAPTDSRVLIAGESGTGKELVAAAIHDRSPRRDRPFVRVNCAAIPRDLVESEMFGHEKGAFTGATSARVGRFELAHTGTLFLDEVGDLSLEAQAKLLRAIEAKEIQRVGGNRTIRVDVRVIAATNKALDAAVAAGAFREDLYFRLNVIPIPLPPLRERENDVVELARHFSWVQHQRTGHPMLHWSEEALAVVRGHSWPGNVRELANIVERIAILNDGSLVRAVDVRAVLPDRSTVSAALSGAAPAGGTTGGVAAARQEERGLTELLDETERSLISDALARADGNVAEAARQLHTDRPNLYRRMKRLGLAGVLLALALPHAGGAQGRHHNVPHDSVATGAQDTASTLDTLPDEAPRPRAKLLSVTSGKVYNRAEGFPIMLGPALTVESRALDVDAAAYGIVRTAPGIRVHEPDAGHDAHVELRFGPDHMFGLKGQLYNVVAPVERWQITEPEAGLAAFFLHRDYMDYYSRHGGGVTARWVVNDKADVTAGYAVERWGTREGWSPFSLFRNNEAWRENPLMDAGRFHLFTLGATLDTRNDEHAPAAGWYLTGMYENGQSPSVTLAPRETGGGGPTVTSLHYGRVFADVRRYTRISPRTQVNWRAVFGGWVSGDQLPLERTLSLGGPGTLPGYDFHVPDGRTDGMLCTTAGTTLPSSPALCDRVALGQLEFRTELTKEPLPVGNVGPVRLRDFGLATMPIGVLFVDAGRGWRMREPWSSAYRTDAGAGVDFGLLGVYVAKALTDWSLPAHVLVRVRRRF